MREADECWPWTGTITSNGYGYLWAWGKKDKAHRVAYVLANGPIPDGYYVCHHCDNPPCVNPAHLFLGRNADNQRDSVAKARHGNTKKTRCPRDHPYDEVNTRYDYRGRRYCHTCQKLRNDIRYQVARPQPTASGTEKE